MNDPLRILIVDDHAIVRQGLRAVMRVLPGMEWAGEAKNGREALSAVAALQPDLVLMDLVMPDVDGVAAIAL
jgi:YesN/AraC family two-component response regulator